MVAREKHSSLLDPFVSHAENETLRIKCDKNTKKNVLSSSEIFFEQNCLLDAFVISPILGGNANTRLRR